MDVSAVLRSAGGVATLGRLRRLGLTRHDIWTARAAGDIRQVRHGVYALSAFDQDTEAALLQLRGVLSCAAAAAHHGLPVLSGSELHVTVAPGSARARLDGVEVHRRPLRPDEHDGRATTLLRTVLDCGRELPWPAAVPICDAALRRGLDAGWLQIAAAAARGPGSAALRRAVAAADPAAESLPESLLRLLAAPLGELQSQVYVPGVGRVDLLLDGWLVLEADGFAFHSARADYRNDRRRANGLVTAGFVLLRFSYEDIVGRPAYVIETIRAAQRRRRSA